MTALRDISLIYASFFSLVLLLILLEPRCPEKKAVRLAACWMIPLLAVNGVLLVLLGPERMSTLLLLTCSLPSLVFFWFLANHRDGRFFFTFCLADTLVLEVICITTLLDHVSGGGYLVMFASRLILCPLLAWALFRHVRLKYRELLNMVTGGWTVFSVIAILFYVLLSFSLGTPTLITERPEQLPAFVLLLILMPAIYLHIFTTLLHQQEAHELAEQDNILKLQVAGMADRMEAFSAADERFRIERHDFRHKMQTIAALVEQGEYEKLRLLALAHSEAPPETPTRPYTTFPVIDAVLSTYLQKAKEREIAVTTRLAFPEPLPVEERELATVFANAIENAIHACEKLEPPARYIEVKVLTTPHFMLQISNSFDGIIEFDKNGLPISRQQGHGFGTRSIAAFCEKYGAFYEFKATADRFCLRITFG